MVDLGLEGEWKSIMMMGFQISYALTATATPKVQSDIVRLLGLPEATTRIVTGFNRLNLTLEKYIADLQLEMAELINANPQTPEERHQVFLLKKRIVDTVLAEVRIDENREIHVKFRTDFLNQAR